MKFRSIFQSKDIKKVCNNAYNIMGVGSLPKELARAVASNYAKSMIRNSGSTYVSSTTEQEMDRIQADKELAVANQMF
jgi:hypothetical protein